MTKRTAPKMRAMSIADIIKTVREGKRLLRRELIYIKISIPPPYVGTNSNSLIRMARNDKRFLRPCAFLSICEGKSHGLFNPPEAVTGKELSR